MRQHLKKVLSIKAIVLLFLLGCGLPFAAGQQVKRTKAKTVAAPPAKGKSFVIDTVRFAVSLTQPDPQDRLRVLAAAIPVVSSADRRLTRALVNEGVRVESELIATDKVPVTSVLAYASCGDALGFVQHIYPAKVGVAEQSLLNVYSRCPQETGELVERLFGDALREGAVAPRLAMAIFDKSDAPRATETFNQVFSSLPANAQGHIGDADELANAYASAASKVESAVAQSAGMKLLDWLAKIEAGGERTHAVSVVVGGMKDALGEPGLQRALERDMIASQLVADTDLTENSEMPADDSAATTESEAGGDEQDASLDALPDADRAKKAAALGFAAGTSKKDRAQAAHYFDVAFAAANEAWNHRSEGGDDNGVAAMMVEVCEAAAHVDLIDALTRAQKLQDPTAQAIGMIAVARVANG